MHGQIEQSLHTSMLGSFDSKPQPRLVYGPGRINDIGKVTEELLRLEGHVLDTPGHVLVVTDKGIVEAGHAETVLDRLKEHNLSPYLFDQVVENPTTEEVNKCVDAARDSKAQLIIGLGGGSSMDTAKGCNFILTNGGEMADYKGRTTNVTQPMLPMIAIPTTAGTGSECQSFALISDAETHVKMACGHPAAMAKVALLDPRLTLSQPARVAACTGVDTLSHALETAVTKERHPTSLMYARESFRLAVTALPIIFTEPEHLLARGAMQLAAALAGSAIENSMLGGAHACANPLTARYNVVHGEAVGMMLPAIIRFNRQDGMAAMDYARLNWHARMSLSSLPVAETIDLLISELEHLLSLGNIPKKLSDHNIHADDIDQLAEDATQQWTGHFNPRPISKADFVGIYTETL